MTGVELIKQLRKKGIHPVKTKGSHYHYNHNGRRTQVPHHHKELPPKTYHSIMKALGLK